MFVSNGVVKDNFWEVENYFESKRFGFIGAVHTYETPKGSVVVLFSNRVACVLMDDETGASASKDEIMYALKDLIENEPIENTDFESEFGDSYSELGTHGILDKESGVLDFWGFSEDQVRDIEDRFEDIETIYAGYSLD